MSKKMLFIFNPKAGKGSIKNKLMDIIDIFVKGGYEITVHPTQEYLDAMKVAKECGGSYDILVCSGGDGTLDEVVTGMMQGNHEIPLGYIPAGSTNDFASSLRVSKNMLKAAHDIVNGDLFPFDVGKFNNDTFVYIAAFGLFTDVAYETNQDLKNLFGHLAYILGGMQRLFNIRAYNLKVEYNNRSFDGEFIFGMITNSTSVGGFKNLSGKNVGLNDGLFEVMFIRKPKNPLELQEIVSALLMAEDNTDLIESFKTNHLFMTGEEVIPWTLDGEYGGEHRTVDIVNQKCAMQIKLSRKEGVPLMTTQE